MDLKISQFPLISDSSLYAVIPVVQSGNNYTIALSALFTNGYDISNSGNFTLSGDNIVLSDNTGSRIEISDGSLRIIQNNKTVFSSDEYLLNDSDELPSVSSTDRVLYNTNLTPLVDWSGNILNFTTIVSGIPLTNEAATYPIVSILSAINSQTVKSLPYYDETHVILTTTSLSALSWSLPKFNVSRIGQIKTFYTNQNITTLIVSVSGGGSFIGTPLTTANSNQSYSFQCIGTGTWLRLA